MENKDFKNGMWFGAIITIITFAILMKLFPLP